MERNKLKSIGSDMFLWIFHHHLVHLVQLLKYHIYSKLDIHLSDLEGKLTFGMSAPAQLNIVATSYVWVFKFKLFEVK